MAKIEHVVVLMLENRSFDHVLGWLESRNPNVDGLRGTESNPVSVQSFPPSPRILVSNRADWNEVLSFDPPHEFGDVTEQIFGTAAPSPGQQASMDGFFQRAARRTDGQSTHEDIDTVLRGYAPGRLPAIHALAEEFVVCDRWFSSVPGPTWPNRFFAHCGTAGGFLDGKLRTYDMPTIFNRLGDADQTWRIYFHDVPQAFVLSHLGLPALTGHFQGFASFIEAAANGTLPAYAFIEPNYSDVNLGDEASDQHPPSPMRAGDELVRKVYQALRASPQWKKTMLVVTWDEHGGFFDHVAPPAALPPDGAAGQFGFRFDRLGVRVPAIIVSPWVQKGFVDHTVYEHASIPATLGKIFGLEPLTERDRHAATFERLAVLDAPRETRPTLPMTPTALPDPAVEEDIDLGPVGAGARRADGEMGAAHGLTRRSSARKRTTRHMEKRKGKRAARELTNLQRSLVEFVESIEVAASADEGRRSGSRRAQIAHGDERARLHAAVEKMARILKPSVARGKLPRAMPEREASRIASVATRVRNVLPDKLDLRDRMYAPRISVAPPPSLAPIKLPHGPFDQESTSACTGYALASVIDHLLARASWSRDGVGQTGNGHANGSKGSKNGTRAKSAPPASKHVDRVSPRMLYSMARRYDEFPGASADTGSSLRGALKGWFRNGACRLDLWDESQPIDSMPAARPTGDWWRDAFRRPLGAYYRIDRQSVPDLQAALHEAEVVLVSARTHAGWFDTPLVKRGSLIPDIPFRTDGDAGHAFVLIGYDDVGFYVFNSWGDDWGASGVARLGYADWLANGMDAWVAQLGVPTQDRRDAAQRSTLELTGTDGAANVTLSRDAVVGEQEVSAFILDTGNHGRLSGSGRFRTMPDDVRFLLEHHLPLFRKQHGLADHEPTNIAIYAHGGLVDENAAAETARAWIPALYASRRFPIFVMWETGLVEILKNIFADWTAAASARVGADWLDQRLEQFAAPLGARFWSKMKLNAAELTHDSRGVFRYLFEPLVTSACLTPKSNVRLELIGHSAGSIVLSELAAWLVGRGHVIERATFMAPAIRVDRFEQLVLPHIGREVRRYEQFSLTDGAERADPTVPLYGKSLLYLVSRSFEGGRDVPILGMANHIPKVLHDAPPRGPVRIIYAPGNESQARTHGGFDDDCTTRDTILARPTAGERRRTAAPIVERAAIVRDTSPRPVSGKPSPADAPVSGKPSPADARASRRKASALRHHRA